VINFVFGGQHYKAILVALGCRLFFWGGGGKILSLFFGGGGRGWEYYKGIVGVLGWRVFLWGGGVKILKLILRRRCTSCEVDFGVPTVSIFCSIEQNHRKPGSN